MRNAEDAARAGRNRGILRSLHALRGEWRLALGDYTGATNSFAEASRMVRETHREYPHAETLLALAKLHLGELPEPRHEAERLSHLSDPANRPLAELWLAIGDRDLASKHALKAYEEAWADGEPYVFLFGLNRAKALLEQLGTPIPDLQPYDPANDPRESWEEEVEKAIETLKAEKAAEKGAKKKAKRGGRMDEAN